MDIAIVEIKILALKDPFLQIVRADIGVLVVFIDGLSEFTREVEISHERDVHISARFSVVMAIFSPCMVGKLPRVNDNIFQRC